MNCKKIFAILLSLVFICSSFLVVNADSAAGNAAYVEVSVTEGGLDFAAVVPASVASAEAFAVTFTQNDTPAAVTEYTVIDGNYIYSYATEDTSADVSVAIGEDTIACAVARFNGEVGSKYAIYAALTAGDANSDSTTDIKDVVRIKRIIANDTAIEATSAADIDGDGNVVATDLVLLAKYIILGKKGILSHTVTFVDANGTMLDVVSVPDGFKAVPTVIPTKNADGYDFEGWDTSVASISDDVTITAVYGSNISGNVPDDWDYNE